MYFTDRGIEELEKRRGEEEVTFEWLAEQLREFVDLNPDFEVPVERLATWLARLDDEEDRPRPGCVRLTWLGHSTVLVHVEGLTLVADPLLRRRTGALRRLGPLPGLSARLVTGEDRVDAVLVSHLHHDHCDLPSLRALAAPTVIAPPRSGGWLTSHGVENVVELTPGRTLQLSADVTVTATEADHSGKREPFGPLASAVGHLVSG